MFQPMGGDDGDVTAAEEKAGQACATCGTASETKSRRDQEQQAAAANTLTTTAPPLPIDTH